MKTKKTVSDIVSEYQGVYRRLYGKGITIEVKKGGWLRLVDQFPFSVRPSELAEMAKRLERRL